MVHLEAADRLEAGLLQHEPVLHAALAPSLFTAQVIEKGRRVGLVAFGLDGNHPDFVATSTQENAFHDIVAEDAATQRRFARENRQHAVLVEGLGPDHGVVAPVKRTIVHPPAAPDVVRVLPIAQAKLEEASKGADGRHAGELGLQQAHLRMFFHTGDHTDQQVSAHSAIGVEHHEEVVPFGVVVEIVLDVASLKARVLIAAAVYGGLGHALAEAILKAGEAFFFHLHHIRKAGVADHDKPEVLKAAGLAQAFAHGVEAGEDRRRVFIAHADGEGRDGGDFWKRTVGVKVGVDGFFRVAESIDAHTDDVVPRLHNVRGGADGGAEQDEALEEGDAARFEHGEDGPQGREYRANVQDHY